MNKNVLGASITLTIIAFIIYCSRKNKANKKLNPYDLPEPLKSFYQKLNEKGYNPQTNPLTHKNPFVSFTLLDGEDKIVVTVNYLNLVLINVNNKIYQPIKFTGKDFTINNQIVSESSDLLEGVLEILENKNYIQ